jgi:hypothetical protein
MPSYVVKCEKDVDFYVYWSDITENPWCWGDRETLLEYLYDNYPEGIFSPEERIEHADTYGCSARWPSWTDPIYGWDSRGFVYEQRGILPRTKLRALCEALEREDEEAAWDLLEPFEDRDSVRRG